ncbi:putative thymidylate synthase [Klebsiella phage UTI-K1]|nr:putative thymidylate synthase [Klebsiella phage UTI-K1]
MNSERPKELCELEINYWPPVKDKEFHELATEEQLAWVTGMMKPSDFVLEGYKSHPTIKGKMAI